MATSTVNISFEPQSDHLIVRVHTRYILTQMEAAVMAIASVIAERPIKAALLDLRAVPGPYTFMDRVGLGEVAGRHLAGTPIAAVVTEEQADPERIGKLVARNRGANVEVFLDPTEAWAWMQTYLMRE